MENADSGINNDDDVIESKNIISVWDLGMCLWIWLNQFEISSPSAKAFTTIPNKFLCYMKIKVKMER